VGILWLKRFSKEGLDGLRDRRRSGRPPKLPLHVITRIRSKLSEREQAGLDLEAG